MSGRPYEDRDPAYPPLYTGAVGNPAPAGGPVGGGLGGRLAVRRPLRPGRAPPPGARADAVPGQRPPRSRPVPRRPAGHADQHAPGPQPVRPAPDPPGHPGHPGAALDAGRLQPALRGRRPPGRRRTAQPAGLHRRHRQPGCGGRHGDGPLCVGPARRRRAGLDRGRHVPGRAGHPHAGRVLGPHPAVRAGGDHRPPQGHGRAVHGRGRDRRARLRVRPRRRS